MNAAIRKMKYCRKERKKERKGIKVKEEGQNVNKSEEKI